MSESNCLIFLRVKGWQVLKLFLLSRALADTKPISKI